MRIERVTVEGFRGHELDVELPLAGVLTGPNGCGKSSLLHAAQLALGQTWPGAENDNKGVASTSALQDATAAAEQFRVVATDSEGESVAFEYSAEANRRNLVASWLRGGSNDAVREAIRERYGSPTIGATLLDFEALRAMDPAALERLVFTLCSGTSEWTAERIISRLAELAPEKAKAESLAELGEQVVRLTGELDEAVYGEDPEPDEPDVRVVLQRCRARAKQGQTDARSAVLATTATLDMAVPEAPELAEVTRLEREAEAAQAEAYAATTRESDVRARLKVAKEQRDKERAEREQRRAQRRARRDEAQKAVGRADVALKVATETVRDLEARKAALAEELGKVRAELAQPFGPTSSPITEQRAAAARKALAAAKKALAAHRSEEPPQLPDDHASDEAAARQEVEQLIAELNSIDKRRSELDVREELAKERLERLEDGTCPECGQPVAEVAEDILSDIGGIQNEVQRLSERRAKVVTSGTAARKRVHEYEAIRQRVATEQEAHSRRGRDLEQDVELATRKADQAQKEHEAALAAGDEGLTRLRDRANALEERVGDLDKMLEQAKGQLEGAKVDQDRAARALDAVPADDDEAPGPDATELLDALVGAEEAAREAKKKAHEAQLAWHEARAQRRAADQTLAAQEEAKARRTQAQAWRDLWACVEQSAFEVERQVLEDMVAPLVEPVNKMAQAYALHLGTFEPRFGKRFQLGWGRPAGFAPLQSLSTGHLTLTVLLLAAAVHRLAESPLRLVLVDNGEALDERNRPVFARLAGWLVAKGYLDQVVIGSVDEDGWDALEVVELGVPHRAAA